MFCDLVGSTTLATHFDPEDLREIIGAYHKRVAKVVGRFDGFIAKYMGDGVLAYFGYPKAHEDDAERAVRAGLKLVEKVGELTPRPGVKLRLRVGIGTGLAVVGDLIGSGEAQERGIVGETPNLAARLQVLAEPDAVVVEQTTRKLLGALFECCDLGRVEVKGLVEPIQAWRVLRASAIESRFEALHSTALTPLVGREEELELLQRRWERAATGEGQVVLLSGEPGIGKSRVVAALQERLQGDRHMSLRHFCSAHRTASALYPIVSRLEHAARFERDDNADAKREKFQALLGRTSTPEQDVALLMRLLAIEGDRATLEPSPRRLQEKTLEALLRQVEALARQRPRLVIFEDVHWIDPTSRELVDLLVDRVQYFPALLLLTFRPEFDPPWTGRSHVTSLVLNRLQPRVVSALIGKITGAKPLPAEVTAQIVARTDGVPLFAEELTKTIIEGGIVRDAGDRYVLDSPLLAVAIPSTLHASLLARLDHLASVREIAQIGAAIGREFSYELIAAVAPLYEGPLREALTRLVASGLIFSRGTPPGSIYVFKHALVQDAAYETLLKSQRLQLHASIAQVLERDFAGAIEAQPELLAHHFARAGNIKQATAYLHMAGRQALARSAMTEARMHLTQALDLLATLPAGAERDQKEVELQVALGGAYLAVKGFAAPEAGRAYARARELCAEGSPLRLQVLSGLHQYYHHCSGAQSGRVIAEELLRLAEQHQEPAALAAANRAFGVSSLFSGMLSTALEHFERAIVHYERSESASAIFQSGTQTRVACVNFIPLVWLWQGHLDRAVARSRLGLAAAQDLGHAYTMSHVLHLNCWLHQHLGDHRIVRERASAMTALTSEHDYPLWLSSAKTFHGWATAVEGAVEAGIAELREGLTAKIELGVKNQLPHGLSLLAEVFLREGRSADALGVLNQALSAIGETGERWFEAELRRLKAQAILAASPGNEVEGEGSLHKALAVAREQGARFWELRAATGLARLWCNQGKRADARDLLAPIYGWFTEGFDTPDLKDARTLLDELSENLH